MVKPRSEALIGWEMMFNIIFNVNSVIYRGSQFLAHLAKGNVSFCHNLASVVCRPLTFHILIFSETAKPIDLKFGRKHLWKVLYKENSCF
jgi:hypothetical protein